MQNNIESKIEALIEPEVKGLGYDLYDVEYVKEGKSYFLRVYIDSKNGIDLEDCEAVSRKIDSILDEQDYIKEQYFLEVSSPGLERVLRKEKHLKQNIGNDVEIRLYKSYENSKVYTGILKSFDNENITLDIENKEIVFERKNVALIKTVYKFD